MRKVSYSLQLDNKVTKGVRRDDKTQAWGEKSPLDQKEGSFAPARAASNLSLNDKTTEN